MLDYNVYDLFHIFNVMRLSYPCYSIQALPTHLRPWLLASGSLTQQLTQLAGGEFSVNVIREHYQRVSLMESQWLAVPHTQQAWIRESELYGCERMPWVKAKSIIPQQSLQKKARLFKQLKQKPMGKLLFQRIQPQCERRVIRLPEGWTRQSCYTWYGCKLIVQETFLDAFETFILKA